MAVKDRLEQRRKRLGLEVKEAARNSDIGLQYWYKLESGTNNPPTWKILVKLAKGLQTSVDYILELTDDPTPPAKRGQWTPEAITAAQLITTAPPEKQAGALAVLKSAVELAQDDNLGPAAAPANTGGGVTFADQQQPAVQQNLSAEKDMWLALLQQVLSPEDYRYIAEAVQSGQLSDAHLARFLQPGQHKPVPQNLELFNHNNLSG